MPPFLTSPALAGLSGISHGFFGREGGVSPGIYASLNCGWGTASDRSENVEVNRARVASALGVAPGALVSAHQAHTARVVEVLAPWSREDAPKADGLVTRKAGVALGVLAADCIPDPCRGFKSRGDWRSPCRLARCFRGDR